MWHVLTSESGMPVAHLMRLAKQDNGIYVQVRWKGLSTTDYRMEPLRHVAEDVPDMLENLFKRKGTPQELVRLARAQL